MAVQAGVALIRMELIRSQLEAALQPSLLTLRDDSAQHAGHAGARDGRGHFHVTVVSEVFRGKSSLQQHRLIYAALGELMSTDIHALSITASAPQA